MAKIKGVAILNARGFAIANHGEDGWERVLRRLAADDRQALAEMLVIGWYDLGIYDRVNRAMIDALGNGEMAFITAVGRYSAEHDLKTLHRLFLRMANPAYVLERLTEFWGRYQDSGTWTVVRETPTRVRATLEGWGSEDEATCARLGAYTQRLFELVGAKNVVNERVRCRARGDAACVFLGQWE